MILSGGTLWVKECVLHEGRRHQARQGGRGIGDLKEALDELIELAHHHWAWEVFWERDDEGNLVNLHEDSRMFRFLCPYCDYNNGCGNSLAALHDLQELAIKHIIGHKRCSK